MTIQELQNKIKKLNILISEMELGGEIPPGIGPQLLLAIIPIALKNEHIERNGS